MYTPERYSGAISHFRHVDVNVDSHPWVPRALFRCGILWKPTVRGRRGVACSGSGRSQSLSPLGAPTPLPAERIKSNRHTSCLSTHGLVTSLPITSTHTGSSCVCASGTSGASSAAIASGASGASKHSACGGFSPRRSGSPLNAKNQDRCLRKNAHPPKGGTTRPPRPRYQCSGRQLGRGVERAAKKTLTFSTAGLLCTTRPNVTLKSGEGGLPAQDCSMSVFFADTGLNTDLGAEFR